jgi:hypothetical protein
MGITALGVLLGVILFASLAAMSYITREKVIEQPMRQARARGSAVAEFVDDLQRYRWGVILGLAVLVVIDKRWRFSGGLLQTRLALAGVVTLIFVGRMVWRRRRIS